MTREEKIFALLSDAMLRGGGDSDPIQQDNEDSDDSDPIQQK